MGIRSWLRTWNARQTRNRRGRSSQRSPAKRPPPTRLLVEPLEDRTVPSILFVNSAADDTTPGDGLVTLREAIEAANTDTTTDLGATGNGADFIFFLGSLDGATIASAGRP